MSNRSRARFRAENDDGVPAPDPDTAAAVDDMVASFDKGDNRGAISRWAGLVLRDRANALAVPEVAAGEKAVTEARARRDAAAAVEPIGLREPTPYEASILHALGNRTAVIDMSTKNHPSLEVRVDVVSGGIYGGTVEPERVAGRRRRNKAARAARSGRRRRVHGHVYRSRFGYAHNHDPLGRVAEVVDAA